ncbi:HAD family hydrolase [Corynebacterium sp. SY003]|uniref:HAD family hydrolase n=1 Tax=unclassified Corynebacterium TaxID=2624378 RepID=UPI00351AEB71
MSTIPDPSWHQTPQEFLASWSGTHGSMRRFIEELALPPLSEKTQQEAGEAAAAISVAQLFGLELDDYTSGLDSVSGSIEAAGGLHINSPDPEIPQENGVAAFFDVDNTLIQGSSLIVFALGLAKKRYLKLSEIIPVMWKQIKFRLTGSENAQDVAEGRRQALEFIKGKSVDELLELCEEIVDSNISDRLWPGTKQLAEMHLAAGHQVWLVSATPVQLAQVLARRLGLTGALGTVAEVKDGKFTGRLVGDILHGPGKKHAVAALATLERLDLARCTAYSDSINDVPMLSMMGTAVAINPDRQLRKHAEKLGWEIKDYRSIRKAIRQFGAPALITTAFSYSSWLLLKRRGT